MNQPRHIKSLFFVIALLGFLLVVVNLSTNAGTPQQESLETQGRTQQFDFESLSQQFLSHF